jgi:hypothetical protein
MDAAVLALLSETSLEKAAAKVGVSEKTLRRWRKLPEFRAAELAARRDLVEHGQQVVQQLTVTAAQALHRNLTCGKPAVEVKAAEVVFTVAQRAVEQQALTEQLEQLRAEVERLKRGAGDAEP